MPSVPAPSRCEVMRLEPRQMLSAAPLEAYPAAGAESAAAQAAHRSAITYSLSNVPVLNSRSAAPVTIFLDFNGDTSWNWMDLMPGRVPAYDRDGRARSFTAGEISAMRQIWARVSEAYSIFNVNVTTVDPGFRTKGKMVHAVIGGDGMWFNDTAGGVGAIGGFYNEEPNSVYAFPAQLRNGDPKSVALVVIHEVGHAFGLSHQSVWRGSTLVEEYNPGTSAVAPIMGANYDAKRNVWARGSSDEGPRVIQDDLAVLTDPQGAGLAILADDYGNATAAASVLNFGGGVARGRIETSGDVDVFSFTHNGGYVKIDARTATYGTMLSLKIELLSSEGRAMYTVAGASYDKLLNVKIAAGTFYVRVGNQGKYGSLGTYTLRVGQGVPLPPGPSSLRVEARSSSDLVIRWTDRSDEESGYWLDRSTDGITWRRRAVLDANVTAFRDTRLASDTLYYYRVQAFGPFGASKPSPLGWARTFARMAGSRA